MKFCGKWMNAHIAFGMKKVKCKAIEHQNRLGSQCKTICSQKLRWLSFYSSTRCMCMSKRQAVINQRVTPAASRLMTCHSNCDSRAGGVNDQLTETKGLIWHSHLSCWIRCKRLLFHFTNKFYSTSCVETNARSLGSKSVCLLGSSHKVMHIKH